MESYVKKFFDFQFPFLNHDLIIYINFTCRPIAS